MCDVSMTVKCMRTHNQGGVTNFQYTYSTTKIKVQPNAYAGHT